ncbi:hypothetical protein JYU14_00675 [Simkania negevensis]|uniref:Shikimate kinase n=1 Tax=Simkania negevensis TaxID=83561 RepID=A0ABS3AQI1_9BACT|nr:hypothetical protein [Simkania negevensis]
MSLILCGFKSCGKTTVGRQLATRLNLPFNDTDMMIASFYSARYNNGRQCTPRDVFLIDNGLLFRSIEAEIINSLPTTPALVALGGSTLMNKMNRVVIQDKGFVAYLYTPSDVLWQRLTAKDAPWPLFLEEDNKERFIQIYQERRKVYENVADTTVDTTGKTASDIAEELAKGYDHGFK